MVVFYSNCGSMVSYCAVHLVSHWHGNQTLLNRNTELEFWLKGLVTFWLLILYRIYEAYRLGAQMQSWLNIHGKCRNQRKHSLICIDNARFLQHFTVQYACIVPYWLEDLWKDFSLPGLSTLLSGTLHWFSRPMEWQRKVMISDVTEVCDCCTSSVWGFVFLLE